MTEEVIRIRKRGVITIPIEMREQFGIKIGDYIRIISKDNEILIEKIEITKASSKTKE